MKQIINVLQQKGVIMYKNGNFSLSYITQSIIYLSRYNLKLRRMVTINMKQSEEKNIVSGSRLYGWSDLITEWVLDFYEKT